MEKVTIEDFYPHADIFDMAIEYNAMTNRLRGKGPRTLEISSLALDITAQNQIENHFIYVNDLGDLCITVAVRAVGNMVMVLETTRDRYFMNICEDPEGKIKELPGGRINFKTVYSVVKALRKREYVAKYNGSDWSRT